MGDNSQYLSIIILELEPIERVSFALQAMLGHGSSRIFYGAGHYLAVRSWRGNRTLHNLRSVKRGRVGILRHYCGSDLESLV
jgi:hypothetical protein